MTILIETDEAIVYSVIRHMTKVGNTKRSYSEETLQNAQPISASACLGALQTHPGLLNLSARGRFQPNKANRALSEKKDHVLFKQCIYCFLHGSTRPSQRALWSLHATLNATHKKMRNIRYPQRGSRAGEKKRTRKTNEGKYQSMPGACDTQQQSFLNAETISIEIAHKHTNTK